MLHVFKTPAMKTIKVIECAGMWTMRPPKKKLWILQERGEAYLYEIEEDLELNHKLICQIVDKLKREGCLTVLL